MPLSTDPKENMKALIAALRSGQYAQGDLALCNGGRYCCLGVAADLAVKAGEGEWLHGEGSPPYSFLSKDSIGAQRAFLPSPLLKKFGLFENDNDDDAWCLVHLNDSGGYTFTEIADLLERKYINGEDVDLDALPLKAA